MFKPMFNHVLVEVDDKDKAWGGGNNENIGGVAYREGTVISVGSYVPTAEYPLINDLVDIFLLEAPGKHVMWNEGHEAGTVFEEDGKQYGFIYWWDIIGVEA